VVPAALVLGADGLIGEELLRRLRERGWEAVGTRHGTVGNSAEVQFDLADTPAALLNAPPLRKLRSEKRWVAFLVAAITGYARCEQDPIATRCINVTNSINLARDLVESGALVIYPSSSAVFGEATGRCDEASLPSAISEYGRQKADAEKGMLRLIGQASGRGGVAVARLTKVVAARDMVGKWIETLRGGGVIEAATDLLLCPISLPFAAHGLIEIAATGRSGVYHLSGEGVISYFDFAMRLADALGAGRTQVRPVEIGPTTMGGPAGGIELQMSETRKYARLMPQTLDSVLLDVVSSR
jgi:dTDP-4-dehydrorhamnose reductase